MLKILNNRFLSLFTINIISLYELIKTKLAILIVLISDFEYTVHCTLAQCTGLPTRHKDETLYSRLLHLIEGVGQIFSHTGTTLYPRSSFSVNLLKSICSLIRKVLIQSMQYFNLP